MRAVSKVLGACLVTSVMLVSAGCGNAAENSNQIRVTPTAQSHLPSSAQMQVPTGTKCRML